ncbi:ATP-binding cassette domain-containing protein, partial [Chitinimonas sp.]|uniref:ATP-binding cassette domain-containing protein n=1 Tax=Chitinimonas sp. TaxID=1934313 RepID=UPI0035B1E41D
LWHLQKLDGKATEQELRNFLGGFDFRGEMATGPVEPFSGGEKARLALAMIVWQRPNLLLLDEPTNHLDLEMRHALTLALQDYIGAMIVVSHDRHLLRATTDRFWLVEAGRVQPFDGDLDDYKRYRQDNEVRPGAAPADDEPLDRKAQKRAAAAPRQRISQLRKPLEKELAQVESQLTRLNEEKATLDAELAGEAIYAAEQKERLKDTVRRQSEVEIRLGEVEARWLQLQEQLEALSADIV